MKAEDIESIEADISLFAYRRIKRLQHLTISPSVGSFHFREDLQSLSACSSPTGFIPFLRERSSLGKLLQTEESSPSPASPKRLRSVSMLRKTGIKTHPARLKKQPPKWQTPGVGFYPVKNDWGTKGKLSPGKRNPRVTSTSVGRMKPVRTVFPPVSPMFKPFYQKAQKSRRSRPHFPDKFDALRPEVVLRSVKKTNFQSVKLIDSPQDLKDALRIEERRRLKDEKLYLVKRFMRRMLKGKFY